MFSIVVCSAVIFFWTLLIVSFINDRSRYRNCYFLFLALASTVFALTFLAGEHQKTVLVVMMITILVALLIVPIFLICNGIVMLKREGRSLANLLSLFFGIIIALGEIATLVAVLIPVFGGKDWIFETSLRRIYRISIFFSVTVIYISMCFLVFMIYCVFLQIIPRKRDFDYVIIHGAGLLDGDRISKLLADRLDKAIEVYQKDPTPPIMIPSGGKGSDETISEAEAMARYLIDKGIPPEKIIKEDQSLTTFENLKFSKRIIEAREGSKYTVLVTSNYHVYRALRYCRKNKMKCTGVGSHVAFYYWPSALIREFIAVHSEKKHLITFLIGWVLCMIPLIIEFFAH